MPAWARSIGEFERNAEGHWLGEHTEAVMTPAQTLVRAEALSGHWATVERAGRLILIWLVAVISHWLMGKCHCHRRKICSHWLCHHGLGVTRSKLNRLNRSTCVMKLPGKTARSLKLSDMLRCLEPEIIILELKLIILEPKRLCLRSKIINTAK